MVPARLIQPMFEGPIDIVGDIHGEIEPLRQLLEALGYSDAGEHPDGRRIVFLGDLVDRGPDSPAVVELVRGLVERGRAQCILGNHELNHLRRDLKHGSAWHLAPDHEEQRGEFAHSRAAPADSDYNAFFATLPLALERADLRVVHAAWHAPAIEQLRTETGSVVELFDAAEKRIEAELKARGIPARAAEEKRAHALKNPAIEPPLLENIGLLDEYLQTHNPVRVLTSGPERLTARPFYANGKWRMCDRVLWWNEYTDDVPVVIGHYWRVADHDGEKKLDLSGGKPNLFVEAAPQDWVGARRNVFCVDFSIGGRYRERSKGHVTYQTRLAAVRWPERTLVFNEELTGPR